MEGWVDGKTFLRARPREENPPPLPTHVEFPNDGRSKKHQRKEGGRTKVEKLLDAPFASNGVFQSVGPQGSEEGGGSINFLVSSPLLPSRD